MSNKKIVFTVIAGAAGITAAYFCSIKKSKMLLNSAKKSEEDAKNEVRWLSYELDEVEKDNDFLREELTGSNEEIDKLRKSIRGGK